MIKKPDKPADTKPSMTEQVKTAAAQPAEQWNVHWNIHRRLLEARRQLRGSQLWKTFESAKNFEAFSIHVLARGVEDVLNGLGVTSHFATTKWQKAGNTTVIEGLVVFTNVDTGETVEVPTVGEGVDPDDKGMGKADSYARKLGLVNALNLGIGVDNEASQQQAQPGPQAGPTMSGNPQQGSQAAPAKVAEDFIRPPMNGNGANVHTGPAKMYTLQQAGVKARSVLGSGMLSNCWAIIQNSNTVTALDEWGSANQEMLEEFCVDVPTIGAELRKLFAARRRGLEEKGAI